MNSHNAIGIDIPTFSIHQQPLSCADSDIRSAIGGWQIDKYSQPTRVLKSRSDDGSPATRRHERLARLPPAPPTRLPSHCPPLCCEPGTTGSRCAYPTLSALSAVTHPLACMACPWPGPGSSHNMHLIAVCMSVNTVTLSGLVCHLAAVS